MRAFLSLLLVITSLSIISCGGGGGNDGEATIYPLTDGVITPYSGGEELTYDFHYDEAYDDGSGALYADGAQTTYIYSGYNDEEVPNEIYKHVTVIDANSLSSSSEGSYFYDENGNYIHYLLNGGYYSNQDQHSLGSIIMPSVLETGYTWVSNPLWRESSNSGFAVLCNGSMSYTVISTETISVPFGNVETYKINYSGSFSGVYYNSYMASVTGTYWIHPKIGIVKNIETIREGSYIEKNYHFENALRSINWTIE